MADPVRVFVSHHHSPYEDAFTARLVGDLKAAGVDVWVDDEGITSGDFVRKISEGLAGRQWLVLVTTPDALQSPWVRTEVDTALAEVTARRMLGVIPFVITPANEHDMPLLWRNLHRYDATAGYEPARDRLLQTLRMTASPFPTHYPPTTADYTPSPGVSAGKHPAYSSSISPSRALWVPVGIMVLLAVGALPIVLVHANSLGQATPQVFLVALGLFVILSLVSGFLFSGLGVLIGRALFRDRTSTTPIISTAVAGTASFFFYGTIFDSFDTVPQIDVVFEWTAAGLAFSLIVAIIMFRVLPSKSRS
jgi:hypothetical protein